MRALALVLLALACSSQAEHDPPTCEQQHHECFEGCATAACQGGCEAPYNVCIAARLTTTALRANECVRLFRSDEAVPFEVNGEVFTVSNCLAFVASYDGAEITTRGAFVWVVAPGEAGSCTCE